MRSAERHSRLCHARAARLLDGKRNPEVGHERAAILEQDVLGLDVAVYHAVPVRVLEGRRNFTGHAHGVGD